MATLSFRHLLGHNIRDILCVDCATVNDVTKTKALFQFTCPLDMQITSINQCIGNEERPCSWEVTYSFKPEASKSCDIANAKEAFKNILIYSPHNASVNENDKKIIGYPPMYRVKYNVNTCTCQTLDFVLSIIYWLFSCGLIYNYY